MLEASGQSNPSLQGTQLKVPLSPMTPMLMDPALQPQSDMETEPKSPVLVPAGHILQSLLPS